MKSLKIALLGLFILVVAAIFPAWWYIFADKEEDDPDMPSSSKIEKDEYLRLRNEQLFMLRGFDTAKQDSRSNAIVEMERSERRLVASRNDASQTLSNTWKPLGPAPIPVGGGNSGRVSTIAVHPTNPNIVYAGAAQGGLYRSLDGGATWTPLMDQALTLAMGAIAIAPSNPSAIFVGTGEPEFSADSFWGVGIYRIDNADTTPVITGPLNKNAANADIFTGRAISRIIVSPTDPNIIFASTISGVAGLGGTNTGLVLPDAGLYRTSNALAANPTFEKLTIQGTVATSRSVSDSAIEPGNPAHLVIAVVGSGGDGGIYNSTNALDAVPTFTRTLTTGDGSNLGRAELAVTKMGGVVTVFAATGTASGTLFKSVDGGATFPTSVANNFCNPQCFYDMAIVADPADANKVYLGGSPTLPFGRSINGGASFANSSSGLHVDTQVFALAPSDSNIMYFGSDGGIWKTTNVNATPIVWNSLNNSTFNATQFQSVTLHPVDRNYLLGGTQDNGTEFLAPDGTSWTHSDGGDGGFAVIDRNATTSSDVVAYHTYFNSTGSQIGFARALTTVSGGDPNWSQFLGCGGTANGINCADATLFYAPMMVGPNVTGSTGNSLYFGTSRLYRSINQGTTMTDVSGILPGTNARISAIAIAPQSDDVRLVGTTLGTVFLSTTAGATTMTNVTGSIPARYIGRMAIDPTNANIAYVALNGFGLAGGQHIWKTTNLLGGTPTWLPAGGGIPDVPVSAFVVDPANTQTLYAGTDIGVFTSADGGTSWQPFSNGLPRVAVFDMAYQAIHHVLRIATHGRGIWEFNFNKKSTLADFDGDGKTDLSVFRPGDGNWYVLKSNGGFLFQNWGIATDVVTPGDYDNDGKADLAVFRPSTGNWFVFRSLDSTVGIVNWGTSGDIPVAGDYDNDGKTDVAVFRPSTGQWFVTRSSDSQIDIFSWGVATDIAVPGDYDGDGRTDKAIFRPSTGQWFVFRSSDSQVQVVNWGVSTDRLVPGDYDGDNHDDMAVFRPSTGDWFILRSSDSQVQVVNWGIASDIAAPGDFDGDGRDEPAVFRPSNGNWYANQSTGGFMIANWGTNGDRPVTAGYIPTAP